MSSWARRLFAALIVVLATASCHTSKVVDADLAIDNVAVIPMTSESVLEGQTVLIKDGVIVALAPTGEVEPDKDAVTVDGEGKFLIPGLADMHVHVWAEAELPLYVANGVTLVRNMWGEPETLAMRRLVETGEILGPRIVTAGRLTDGDPPIWGEASAVATSAEQVRALMDEQKSAGYDFFKIYSHISLETFDAIAAYSREIEFPFAGHVPDAVSLDHALSSGMATIEHLIGWGDATRQLDGPLKASSEYAGSAERRTDMAAVAKQIVAGELTWNELYDPEKRHEVALRAAENGIWHVPTLAVNKRINTTRRQAEAEFARREMRFIAPAMRASWNPDTDFRLQDISDEELEVLQVLFEEHLRRVKALADAGAPLLTGTDPPNPFVIHGFSIHEELALFVEAGLSPYEALVAATRAPAQFLGELEESGTIEIGKRADLVLLSTNPLVDISATRDIAGVALGGHWLPRAELDGALETIAEGHTVPEDWFADVSPLESESTAAEFKLHYNGAEIGAERFASLFQDKLETIVAQRRTKGFGGSIAESVRYETGAAGSLTRMTYKQTADRGEAEVQVTIEGAVLSLSGYTLDGAEVSQSIELAGNVIVCDLLACLSPVIAALDDLAVGESRELDVHVLEAFGALRFELETWILTRAEDAENARVYEGVSKRRSEESSLRLVVDSGGLKARRQAGKMGVIEASRSGT